MEIGEPILQRQAQDSLFQSDVLALYDYLCIYKSGTPRSPEVRLMAAVLQDAIDCYMKTLHAKTRHDRQLFLEAERWFADPEDDWLFSFASICGILELDPDYIRRCLARCRERAGASKPDRPHRLWNLPGARLRFAT
ncbi:MAG TPA: hypothetical protein VNN77_18075 [candidate division Zixibacteria bacterium]|nr:hypothetical protein [candidate division Zixibacteria bacterium]